MARLIETQSLPDLPSPIRISSGDVLMFSASGGRIQAGSEVLELLGSFVPGLLQEAGEIVSPMGAPGTVMFRARGPGQATIQVITGDPWYGSTTQTLEVQVVS